MERVYKPIEQLSDQEIKIILSSQDIDELKQLPLSVSWYHPNWKYCQDICVKLSEHQNADVRSNAILGLAYIARFKGKLEKHIVKPVLLRALKDEELFEGRARDAIEDINWLLKWNIGKNALEKSDE